MNVLHAAAGFKWKPGREQKTGAKNPTVIHLEGLEAGDTLRAGVNIAIQSWDGHAFDPAFGNEVYSGCLTASRDQLRFESDGIQIQIPMDQIQIRLENGRVFLCDPARPEIQVFTSDESMLLSFHFRRSPHLRTQVEKTLVKREISRRWMLILKAVVICAVVGWVGSLVFGMAVRAAVARIPAEWEAKFGEQALKEIEGDFALSSDSARVAELASLSEPLTAVVGAGRETFRFYIIDHYQPNAFALPGGHVLVTTGLLELSSTPEELLGVIAHEVAHVTERHGFRGVISGAGPLVLVQIIFGNRGSAFGALLEQSGMLIYQTHSQKHEREADALGWDYLVKANINPRGMIDMLEKLRAWEDSRPIAGESGAFSSHPALAKRIEWLEKRWESLPEKTGFRDMKGSAPSLIGQGDQLNHPSSSFFTR